MAEAGTNFLPQACNVVTFLLYQVGKKKKSHLNVILSEPVLWGSGDMSTYEGSRPRPTPPLRWLYGLVSLAPRPKIWIGPNDGPIIC